MCNIDKRNYLNGLLEALTGLDVVKLTLAFEPTSISIDKFWSKIVEITGRHVLLDIFYKPRILGGAHVSSGGEYKDFSLEKALDAEIDKGAISILSVGLNKEASNSKKQSANAASAATKA